MSPVPILMYHNIDAPPRGVRLRGLYVKPGRFLHQMHLLRWLGYQGLSMTAALPYLRGERSGRVAVITFDDGYRDNLENALPVLADLGFSATCYVVAGEIGHHNHWDAEALGVRKPLMDAGGLRAWRQGGMEIGAHTRSHARLTELPEPAMREEISAGRQMLEDLLGAGVPQFCYPYGAAGERERDAVREMGFASAVTVHRGRARVGDDPWLLPRVAIGGHHGPHMFPLQILTGYEDRRH